MKHKPQPEIDPPPTEAEKLQAIIDANAEGAAEAVRLEAVEREELKDTKRWTSQEYAPKREELRRAQEAVAPAWRAWDEARKALEQIQKGGE